MMSSRSEWEFDVFLSFRGDDTRQNFIRHLYDELVKKGIKTFKDDILPRGKLIFDELKDAIKRTRCAIVIFSRNYAESRWCLDELAWIMECREHNDQYVVLPVFLPGADPSDVRNQKGNFGKFLAIHEKRRDRCLVERWRDALYLAAELSGRTLTEAFWDEKKLIELISKDVLSVLSEKGKQIILEYAPNRMSRKATKHPIEIETRGRGSNAGASANAFAYADVDSGGAIAYAGCSASAFAIASAGVPKHPTGAHATKPVDGMFRISSNSGLMNTAANGKYTGSPSLVNDMSLDQQSCHPYNKQPYFGLALGQQMMHPSEHDTEWTMDPFEQDTEWARGPQWWGSTRDGRKK